MERKFLIAAFVATTLLGCTAKQSSRLGFRKSTITWSAQQMSQKEICEVYLYGRRTTQTMAAVASEWSRRKLSRLSCDDTLNEFYISSFTKWLILQDSYKLQNNYKKK